MQYCRQRIGHPNHTVRAPRRGKPDGSPLGNGAVRDTVPLPRDDRCAAVDIDANLGVRARGFRQAITPLWTVKLCCEAGPAPADRRRQQPGRTIVSDTTFLSIDRLLRLEYQPWFCER